MIDYKTFEVKDFLSDELFRDWVLGHSEGAGVFWKNWLGENPDKAATVEQAKELLLFIASKYEKELLTLEEKEFELNRLEGQLDKVATEQPVQTVWWLKAVAASVVLALGVWSVWHTVSYTSRMKDLSAQLIDKKIEYFNNSAKQATVTLSDGSSVLLSPHSGITYPQAFTGGRREVLLSGEAFFEVEKDSLHPFFVQANGVTTKVLGTSFTISSFDSDSDVRVIVKTGKVAVFAGSVEEIVKAPLKEDLTLLHGEQVIFNRDRHSLQRAALTKEDLQRFPIQEKTFVYDSTPIMQVFAELEATYGISIASDTVEMSHCFITGSLADKPLGRKLELICAVLDGSYQMNGNVVTVSGKGCK